MLKGAEGLTACLVVRSQAAQGRQRLTLQLLPIEQCPFLKEHAVGQGKPLEKTPSVQVNSLFQASDSLSVCCLIGRLRKCSFQELGKPSHVYVGVAVTVELDRLPGDLQE
jgi:hypothetical protein